MNARTSLLAGLGMSLVMTCVGCGGVDYPVVTPSVPRPYPTPAGAAVPSVRPVVPLAPVFIGQPEEGVLPNGVRVRVYTDASLPLVSVAFVMTRGASSDDTYALRWLFSRAMLGSTSERARQEARSDLNYVATHVRPTLFPDGIVWSFDTIEPLWTTGFRRVSAMLSDPQFRPDDLETDVRECDSEDDPRARASGQVTMSHELHRLLYGDGHPFVRAARLSCAGISREALVSYRDKSLSPANLTLVVTGNVSLAEVLVEAKDELAGLVDHGVFAPVPVPNVRADLPPHVTFMREESGNHQVHFVLGFGGVSASSPDLPALRVLAEALGAPFTGRLNSKVRSERGSTYGVHVRLTSSRTTGHVEVGGAVGDEDARSSISSLLTELDRTRHEPLTARELGLAKKSALTSISRSYEGASGAMSDLVALTLGGVKDRSALALGVDATSAEDVRRVAEKYLRIENVQVVVAGHPDRLAPVKTLFETPR